MKNKSFRKRLNKIGPKIDPCGTPANNSDHELYLVFGLNEQLPKLASLIPIQKNRGAREL